MSTSYAQTKRVENLHLTRERDRRRGRELATFLLVGLPMACALLAYAALHIETVRVGLPARGAPEDDGRAERGEPPAARRAGPASSPERVAAVAAAQGPAPARTRDRCRYVEPPGAGRPRPVNGVRRGRTRLFALVLAAWGAVVIGAPRADPDRRRARATGRGRSASRSGASRSRRSAARSWTARDASSRSRSKPPRSTPSPTRSTTRATRRALAGRRSRPGRARAPRTADRSDRASSGSAGRSTPRPRPGSEDAEAAAGSTSSPSPSASIPKGAPRARRPRLRRDRRRRPGRASSTSTTGRFAASPASSSR